MKFVPMLIQIICVFFATCLTGSAMASVNKNIEQASSLTADQILERVKAVKEGVPAVDQTFKYLRKATILDLKTNGAVRKKTVKTYRAYTDGRDQELLDINGKPASARDQAKDRAHNLERQQKFLHRQSRKDSKTNDDDLMTKNMDLFRDKFKAVLKGEVQRKDRTAYVIELTPDTNHKLENSFVDRLMNEIRAKVWVDQKEFRISRLEMKLSKQVSFLGGFAGLLRDIQIDVDQRQLKPEMWVDEKISAFFDVRVFFKTYRFKMDSESSGFELIKTDGKKLPRL